MKPSGAADVRKAKLDVAAELARLEALTSFDLRGEWRRLHGMQPPKRLSRDLMIRGITYKLQERAYGGLAKSVLRRISGAELETLSKCENRKAPRVTVQPGTQLVREWNGQTHTVLVRSDGVEWRGKRYRSLSVVAREITGAHWSGPRFFGLTSSKGASDG